MAKLLPFTSLDQCVFWQTAPFSLYFDSVVFVWRSLLRTSPSLRPHVPEERLDSALLLTNRRLHLRSLRTSRALALARSIEFIVMVAVEYTVVEHGKGIQLGSENSRQCVAIYTALGFHCAGAGVIAYRTHHLAISAEQTTGHFSRTRSSRD